MIMRICTIVARNYLGQAEVLAESFREHHPNGEVSVLVVDDRERLVESRPGLYDVVRPEDVAIPRFEGMAAMYDIIELCTAVKPWLLRHLLDAGEPVAYFDPDICFYAGIDEVVDLAREHQIVLIPHLTNPFPDDGRRPTPSTCSLPAPTTSDSSRSVRERSATSYWSGGPRGFGSTASTMSRTTTSSTNAGSISCPGMFPAQRSCAILA